MNKERSNYIIQVGSSAFCGYFISYIMKLIVRSVIYSIIRELHQRSGDFDSATTGYCKSRTAFRVSKKGDEGKDCMGTELIGLRLRFGTELHISKVSK